MMKGYLSRTVHRWQIRICFWMLILFSCVLSQVSAQKVAIKNNFLYDAALTPNLGVEVFLSPRWTAGLNVGYLPWPSNDRHERKWKHFLFAPEARYWLCSAFSRDFIGVNAVYSHYNVGNVHFPFGLYPSVRTHRRQGDLVAVGAFYGYSWILSPHWSIEAEGGLDVGYTWFKNYDCAHCGTYYGRDRKPFVMPKIGLNIVYNIK